MRPRCYSRKFPGLVEDANRDEIVDIGLEQSEVVWDARGCFTKGFGSTDLKAAKWIERRPVDTQSHE
jgi:hypothetical protein